MYTIIPHIINDQKVAEVISHTILINKGSDMIDLGGSLAYEGYHSIIITRENITPEFFDLHNGIAGDIIQKIANYHFHLIIVGDFSDLTRTSIKDFIYECNLHREINFVKSLEEGLARI